MELHSPNAANKLLEYLKAVFFMLKIKSLISRKRFQMDMNLFMQRGKFLGKSFANLVNHTHKHHHSNGKELVSLHEFSNSNPNSHTKTDQNKRGYFPCLHHHSNGKELVSLHEFSNSNPNSHTKIGQNKRGYFPCLQASVVEEGEELGQEDKTQTPLRLEYTSQELHELTTSSHSPLAMRISDSEFSPVEKEKGGENGADVDCDAEEFIRKFYEQLKGQGEVGSSS